MVWLVIKEKVSSLSIKSGGQLNGGGGCSVDGAGRGKMAETICQDVDLDSKVMDRGGSEGFRIPPQVKSKK
jgi:hypothetical protein